MSNQSHRRLLILWLVLESLLFVPALRAQESQPSEYHLKAAFLFNFAKFVEWPEEAFADGSSPFVITVLGDGPFPDILENTVKGKTVNNHPFEVRRISQSEDATASHILFVARSETKDVAAIVRDLKQSHVLTVGEAEFFHEKGGMINFTKRDSKIRFQINNDAARAAGLKISSKLLGLAIK